jgi:HEAT repeat protein
VSDVDDVIRLKAIQTLAEVGKDSPEIVQALVDASKSSDDRVRKAAKDALDKLQGPAAKKKREKVDALVKEVKSKDKAARLKAMDDLAAMGPEAKEAGQALVEAMLDKTPAIATKAGDALEKIDPDVYKLVLTLAIDRDARARENAIDSLAKLGAEGKAAVPVLFVASLNVEHASHALQALTKVAPNDARVIDAVLRNLPVAPAEIAKGERFITNSGPRATAISVLDSVTIPPTKSVPALISAMNDPRVRVDAINALGKIGPKAHESVPVLSKLKRDSSENVRDAAGKALEKIEGK